MSEEKTIAKRRQVCDICGQIIAAGTPIRIVRDDYQPGIVRFEHIVCPGTPAGRKDDTMTMRTTNH